MRVHLKNVVQSAVERGVVTGYHRVSKLPKVKRTNADVVVDTMLHSIWESLDGIIDFTDGDNESPDGPSGQNRAIGFSTDAIGEPMAARDEEDDDEEDRVTRETLHRITKQSR